MTEDELVEVYLYHYEPHADVDELSKEEYADYKKTTIDTLGFALFRLRVAVGDLMDSVTNEVKKAFTRRE